MSSDGLQIRTAAEVDPEALAALLLAAFGPAKAEFLRLHAAWWYRRSPHRLVAFEGGRVVGYCALVPTECAIDGQPHPAWWWTDLFVEPAFRGRGIQRALDAAVRERASLVLGIPNATAAAIHRRRGWGVREDLRVMGLPLRPRAFPPPPTASLTRRVAWRSMTCFTTPIAWLLRRVPELRGWTSSARKLAVVEPGQLARLATRQVRRGVITSLRDEEAIRWRYFEGPYLDRLSFFADAAGEPRHVAIVRAVYGPRGPALRILDVLGDPEDSAGTGELLRAVIGTAVMSGATLVSRLAPPARDPWYRPALLPLQRARFCWWSADPSLMASIARCEPRWTFGDGDNDEPDACFPAHRR